MEVAFLAAAAAAALSASAADAAVNIYISETATGVFAQTTGSLDLTGLTFFRQATSSTGVTGNLGYVGTGLGGKVEDGYSGFTGPSSFGDTLFSFASSGAGDPFGLQLNGFTVYVAAGYTSGAAINSSATYDFKTLDSLELTKGTYVFTSAHDSITLHIGEAAPAAVPEPASWAMMLVGFGGIGFGMRRARMTQNSVRAAA